jgi:uncharacterized SAM-binding protein YcdF (DUF218 family)
MKSLLLILALLLVISITGGIILFARNIQFIAGHTYHGRADLIVVLTGASGRINEGVRLLDEGVAPHLYITGVEGVNQFHVNAPGYDIEKLQDDKKLMVDPSAKNTKENAEQTKNMISELDVIPRSILLVTSTYHMPRAELIFKKALQSNIAIYLYPVKSNNYDPEYWWRDFTSIQLLVTEFFKYLWYRLYL